MTPQRVKIEMIVVTLLRISPSLPGVVLSRKGKVR